MADLLRRSTCPSVHATSTDASDPTWRAGCAPSHYSNWHRKMNGRTNNHSYFTIVCIVCGTEHDKASRPETKFCSDACKGKHYSRTMRTKSKLPADHPVMVLIREARRPKPKQKPEPYSWRTPRECPGCACWFTPLWTPSAICCSSRCAKRMSRRRRRAREAGARGMFTWAEFMHIAAKFDYRCAYCGVKPDRLDPDHVVPLSRGGTNTPSNLLPTCLLCNSSKNAMLLHEWSGWLSRRGLPPRATSWQPGDARYTHLTDATVISRAA